MGCPLALSLPVSLVGLACPVPAVVPFASREWVAGNVFCCIASCDYGVFQLSSNLFADRFRTDHVNFCVPGKVHVRDVLVVHVAFALGLKLFQEGSLIFHEYLRSESVFVRCGAGAQSPSSLSSALLEVPWVTPWLWAPGRVDIAAGALAAACFWLEGFWPSSAFVWAGKS